MKLLEFITYCTMKGIVVEHRKSSAGFPKALPVDYYHLHIQARGYTVCIEYSQFKDWTRIVKATLFDHGRSKSTNYKATLEEIVEAIMPNYNMAVRIAQNELS